MATGFDARQGRDELRVVLETEVGVVELGHRLRVVEQQDGRQSQYTKLSIDSGIPKTKREKIISLTTLH